MGEPDRVDVSTARRSAPRLLIYYGIPRGVNGLWDDAAAAELFCEYDLVVFGVGLQDPAHEYHASTVEIIQRMRARKPAIRVFGYIDLSVTVSNIPVDTMRHQVRQWRAVGADSVFFDLAGYTFGADRARQNTMVEDAHGLDMGTMLNADVPEHVLGSVVDARFNPRGAAPRLGPDDFFLLESWVVSTTAFASTGGYRWLVDAQRLADTAISARRASGVKIAAVNSADYATVPEAMLRLYFRMAQAMAIAWNLDAYGFAPPGYSGVAPFVNVVQPFAYDPRYATYVGQGSPATVNAAVTEVSRADVGLVVHIDVDEGVYWCSLPS
jgi:hypothetical protein